MSYEIIKQFFSQLFLGLKDSITNVFLIISLDRKHHEMQKKANNNPGPFERKLLKGVFNSVGVSLFLWFSVCAFVNVLPALRWLTLKLGNQNEDNFMFIEHILHNLFSILWILPLSTLSKFICSFWFTDVSKLAYTMRYGRPHTSSVSLIIADIIYTIIFEIIFLLQTYIVGYILTDFYWLHHIAMAVHWCLLYSLYSFEYKWFNMGITFDKRLMILQTRWPYFLGFGLPMYLISNASVPYYQSTASACLYLSSFPFFIVSGTFSSAPKSPWHSLNICVPSSIVCSTIFTKFFRFRRSLTSRH